MMSPINKWQESSTRVDQSIILAHSNVPCNNDYAHSFNDIENVQSFNKLQRNCFFLVHALISCIYTINLNVHVLVQFFFTYLLRVKRTFGRPCKQRVTSPFKNLQKNGGVFILKRWPMDGPIRVQDYPELRVRLQHFHPSSFTPCVSTRIFFFKAGKIVKAS